MAKHPTTRAFAWRELRLTVSEKRQRALLGRAIRLGHKFERASRLRSFRPSRDHDWVRLVGYAHVVRAVQVCKGIYDLRENPIDLVLMRVLLEAYINLRYITLDSTEAPMLAKDFHDFGEANRVRLLLEIAKRFPRIPRPGNVADLQNRLGPYQPRFKHRGGWRWDAKNLVDRLEAIGRSELRAGNIDRHSRIIALYKETNPYVHSGMDSLWASIARGGGMDAVRPKLRARRTQTSVSLLAAGLFADLLGVAGEALNVAAYDEQIRCLSKSCVQLSRELEKP